MRDITNLEFYKKWVSSFLVNMLRVHYDFYKLWIKKNGLGHSIRKYDFHFFFSMKKTHL